MSQQIKNIIPGELCVIPERLLKEARMFHWCEIKESYLGLPFGRTIFRSDKIINCYFPVMYLFAKEYVFLRNPLDRCDSVFLSAASLKSMKNTSTYNRLKIPQNALYKSVFLHVFVQKSTMFYILTKEKELDDSWETL